VLAEVASEVLKIACDQVGGFGRDGPTENRPVLLGKLDLSAYRLGGGHGLNQMKRLDQSLEALLVLPLDEVSLCLFDDVGGGEQNDVLDGPEDGNTSVLAVGGGEEDVGIEEEAIHRMNRLRAVVCDRVGIEAHLLDRFASSRVVLVVDGV
jgi:hypothetical protein